MKIMHHKWFVPDFCTTQHFIVRSAAFSQRKSDSISCSPDVRASSHEIIYEKYSRSQIDTTMTRIINYYSYRLKEKAKSTNIIIKAQYLLTMIYSGGLKICTGLKLIQQSVTLNKTMIRTRIWYNTRAMERHFKGLTDLYCWIRRIRAAFSQYFNNTVLRYVWEPVWSTSSPILSE